MNILVGGKTMIKKSRVLSMLLVLVLAMTSIAMAAPKEKNVPDNSIIVGQKAFEYVEHLSKVIGPRVAATASEVLGKDYIVGVFKEIGYEPVVQPFSYVRSGRNYNSNNVVAVKPGKSKKEVIVGAHYNSVTSGGSRGAHDNASGVAVMLEVAEMLKNVETTYTIRFIAFGAEEVGLRGATHYVNTMSEADIAKTVAMVNLDSVLAGDIMYVYNGLDQNTWVREQA
jgi:alkaline phosphatase isozyme conversion protein